MLSPDELSLSEELDFEQAPANRESAAVNIRIVFLSLSISHPFFISHFQGTQQGTPIHFKIILHIPLSVKTAMRKKAQLNLTITGL